MVKVRIGEPVGPSIVYYEKTIKNKKFSYEELEKLLIKFEKDLDALYEKLDDRVRIVSYELIFQNITNSEELGFIVGGFDLSVRESRKYSLPYCQKPQVTDLWHVNATRSGF